ncbi:hypothetical protein HK099_002234, partial [Clydaea vesicula]
EASEYNLTEAESEEDSNSLLKEGETGLGESSTSSGSSSSSVSSSSEESLTESEDEEEKEVNLDFFENFNKHFGLTRLEKTNLKENFEKFQQKVNLYQDLNTLMVAEVSKASDDCLKNLLSKKEISDKEKKKNSTGRRVDDVADCWPCPLSNGVVPGPPRPLMYTKDIDDDDDIEKQAFTFVRECNPLLEEDADSEHDEEYSEPLKRELDFVIRKINFSENLKKKKDSNEIDVFENIPEAKLNLIRNKTISFVKDLFDISFKKNKKLKSYEKINFDSILEDCNEIEDFPESVILNSEKRIKRLYPVLTKDITELNKIWEKPRKRGQRKRRRQE